MFTFLDDEQVRAVTQDMARLLSKGHVTVPRDDPHIARSITGQNELKKAKQPNFRSKCQLAVLTAPFLPNKTSRRGSMYLCTEAQTGLSLVIYQYVKELIVNFTAIGQKSGDR
jgi:hypothetical protein